MTKKVEYLEIRVRQLQETINVSNAAKAGLMRERDQALAREAKLREALIETRRLVCACAEHGFNYEKAPLEELYTNNGKISAALKEGQDHE